MKAELRISGKLLDGIRADLRRLHPIAHERVGFLTCGISPLDRELQLFAREYRPVEDGDYLQDPTVGAMVGPDGMRKALQMAYGRKSALFHLHTHGGKGVPGFSGIDLRESARFVPSFFNVIPTMPHGVIVLSNDSARGLLWLGQSQRPIEVSGFCRVGIPTARFGVQHELA